ncbi:MAG: hypothetical protein J0L92_16800 [Deltaproteobacteria bacterium]|nr:hypothetical protein [Deltaproteobacteria bacterium]
MFSRTCATYLVIAACLWPAASRAQSDPTASIDVEPAEPPAATASTTTASDDEARAVEEPAGLRVGFDAGGEYQLRGNALSDIPLAPAPPSGDRDRAAVGPSLGQNYFAEQWLRLRGRAGLVDHPGGAERVPAFLSLVGELDLLYGVAFGDLARGTRPAAIPRDQPGYPGIRLRHLYLEWRSPIGVFRLGQMGFSWGLGLVANDGETRPVFGDYRYGDLVRRLFFATRPLGENSPLTIAAAFDWVAWDLLADFERPCPSGQGQCGDLAFQGVLAGLYEEGDDRFGAYVAYRTQKNWLNDTLDVFVADAFAQVHVEEPTGGRILLAGELMLAQGRTSITRTITHPDAEVQQLLFAAQVGRVATDLDVILEGGYASGDSNTEDGVERRATIDPDHRIGLVLFPEVIAWQTARAAWLAQSPDTFGRASRGAELIPTNGGVSGSFYFFPHATFRPIPELDVRLGGVLAWSSTDVVDPYRQRAFGRATNYRGGDPTRRDLGVEIDASVNGRIPLSDLVRLELGLEGGILFPGGAFDDENGVRMGEVGLARARLGLVF